MKQYKNYFIGGGILLFAVLVFVALNMLRPEPPQVEVQVQTPIVNFTPSVQQEGNLIVSGNGTVRPVRQTALSIEVPGKVIQMSNNFVAGGSFKKGDVLFAIDPADYDNAIAVAESEVLQRQYEVVLAEREVTVAKEEWVRVQENLGETFEADADSELGNFIFKEPQLALAKARLAGAAARLADAQTRRYRTVVRAPYSGRVQNRTIDIGQYAAPGQPVAVIYSTEAVEVAVALSTKEAGLIDGLWTLDAGQNSGQKNAKIPARVYATFGDQSFAWPAVVDRTEGVINPATRMMNVVLRIDDAYNTENGRPPLMIGAFTSVEIQGATGDGYYNIPREALRDNAEVWIYEEGRLRIRSVDVIQELDEMVVIKHGLSAGENVITTKLEIYTDSMAVRSAN